MQDKHTNGLMLSSFSSLLIGFLYLAWLRPGPKESKTPILDIQFCISLTLLVTATSRAFPTVHLSPHVSTYKWISREITFWPWFWHMLGGLVASGLVLFWNTRRIEFHEEQNKALAPPTYTKGGALDGAFEFSKETPRGMMPPASLSISFAKGGGYY
jgi:glycerol uptake facilitator-like aquaporin